MDQERRDQLAADGFIAIAPDFLTMSNIPSGPDSVVSAASVAATGVSTPPTCRDRSTPSPVRNVAPFRPTEVRNRGFCWGGAVSFAHAAHSPTVGAAVVY